MQPVKGDIKNKSQRELARLISYVENETEGYLDVLRNLQIDRKVPVIGITGPPGAGKSTLINALLKKINEEQPGVKMAVLAVDPTSPFTHGALLGDRLRMNEHFNNPDIYIRSLGTRGALGGLSARSIEVTDILRAAGFDYIFIETVGVGQSEIDIVALADLTVVVFVPESGDEIQTIKSGIMEIADIFVVNKGDRDGAAVMMKNLFNTLHERPVTGKKAEVIKTIATTNEGVDTLVKSIKLFLENKPTVRTNYLVAEQAYRLIQHYRMKDLNLERLQEELGNAAAKPDFNIYSFVRNYF